MELFIFIAFLLLMEVQSYKSPAVKVSPEVISEFSSVKVICETPAGVTVKQCYFYINREKEKNIKLSPSCELDLTGAEVLRWAAVKSPASVDINCYYIIHEHGIDKPSSHSPAAKVTVLGPLQKPFISYNKDDVQPIIACEMPLSVSDDVTCSLYTEDVLLYTRVSQTQRRWSGDHYCMFYVTPGELFTQSVSRQLSCDYSLNTEPEIRSPRSDTITVRVSTPANTAHVTTAMTTYSLSKSNPPTSTTKETTFSMATSTLPINRRMSDLSTWMPISTTSTQKTSQRDTKISVMAAVSTTETPESTRTGLEHPDSHQDNTPDPTATSSFIMSENSMYQPSVMAAVSTTETPESTRTDVHKTNASTTPQHPQKVTWFIVLVFTGVGVILTGFICLGCFACKKGRQHNKTRSIRSDVPSQGIGMGSAEIYSLITSEPVTSQPISVGLEHPDSHQDTPDPTATSSFIMAENSMYQPSDVLVNKQQKEGNMENEDVYHLYCTIPDKPVQSNAADQVYSLVN